MVAVRPGHPLTQGSLSPERYAAADRGRHVGGGHGIQGGPGRCTAVRTRTVSACSHRLNHDRSQRRLLNRGFSRPGSLRRSDRPCVISANHHVPATTHPSSSPFPTALGQVECSAQRPMAVSTPQLTSRTHVTLTRRCLNMSARLPEAAALTPLPECGIPRVLSALSARTWGEGLSDGSYELTRTVAWTVSFWPFGVVHAPWSGAHVWGGKRLEGLSSQAASARQSVGSSWTRRAATHSGIIQCAASTPTRTGVTAARRGASARVL